MLPLNNRHRHFSLLLIISSSNKNVLVVFIDQLLGVSSFRPRTKYPSQYLEVTGRDHEWSLGQAVALLLNLYTWIMILALPVYLTRLSYHRNENNNI